MRNFAAIAYFVIRPRRWWVCQILAEPLVGSPRLVSRRGGIEFDEFDPP
jgi:hypothetical protein